MRNIELRPTNDSAPPAGARQSRIRPALVLVLGLLPLTLGLPRHVGLSSLLGPTGGSVLLFVLVTLAWVGVVGWGRRPAPVATLTLTGLAAGCYLVAISATFLVLAGDQPLYVLAGLIIVLVALTLWGSLAGLLALAVQRIRGTRR